MVLPILDSYKECKNLYCIFLLLIILMLFRFNLLNLFEDLVIYF